MKDLEIEMDNCDKIPSKKVIYKILHKTDKTARFKKIAELVFFDLISDAQSDIMNESDKEEWEREGQKPKKIPYRQLARKSVKIAKTFIEELYKVTDKLENKDEIA